MLQATLDQMNEDHLERLARTRTIADWGTRLAAEQRLRLAHEARCAPYRDALARLDDTLRACA